MFCSCLFNILLAHVLREICSVDADQEVGFVLHATDVHALNGLIRAETSPHLGVFVIFNQQCLIDESVDLSNLYADKLGKLQITFENVKGFVLSPKSSPFLLKANDSVLVNLTMGTLGVYDSSGREITAQPCSEYLRAYHDLSLADYEARSEKLELFSAFRAPFGLELNHLNFVKISHQRALCPLLFKDADISTLIFDKLEADLVTNNGLEFSSLDGLLGDRTDVDLNAYIGQLEVSYVYRVAFGAGFFNRHLFNATRGVYLKGTFVRFPDDNVFKPLPFLRFLRLVMTNMREFFHSSDNRWLKSLNAGFKVDPLEAWFTRDEVTIERIADSIVMLELISFQGDYLFPNEDFCLFRHFPHQQLVVPFIERTQHLTPTCTLLFLIQFSFIMSQKYNSSNYYFIDETLYRRTSKCNFTDRLQKCSNFSVPEKAPWFQLTSTYDILYVIRWLELLGPVVSLPLVATIGFLLNLLIVLVVRNKQNQKNFFKGDRVFTYIQLNSAFNCAECFLVCFSLLSECIALEGLFCSSVSRNSVVKLFQLYVVLYGGEVMKTCSIVTSLAFSLERYILATDKRTILARFSKLKIRNLVFFAVGFGLLTCFCKTYELTYDTENTDAPLVFYILRRNRLPLFVAIYALHYALNDLVLFGFNMVTDLMLVAAIRAYLKQKSLMSKSTEEIKQTAKDTNRMVVYLFSMYFFFRLPEFVFYAHLLLVKYTESTRTYSYLCDTLDLCSLLADLIQFLYTLSYCLNVLLYVKFNKAFRLGLKSYLSRKPKASKPSTKPLSSVANK